MCNYFIGWTEAELLAALRFAQEELIRGKTQTSSSAGDLAFTFRTEVEIKERIELIIEALNCMDPEAYPLGIDRAQIVFPRTFGGPTSLTTGE